MNDRINLHFGAFAKPLAEQMDAQNINYPADTVGHWQRDADALTRLRVRQLITTAQARSGEGKLFKKICAEVTPKELEPDTANRV